MMTSMYFPGSHRQTTLSAHEAAILRVLPGHTPGVEGLTAMQIRAAAHGVRGQISAKLGQLSAKGLIISVGTRKPKSGSAQVNAYARTAGGARALERCDEAEYAENARFWPKPGGHLQMAEDRFWAAVYRLLTEWEKDGTPPPEIVQKLDALVDSDDEPAPLDMSPLEYLEGLMGVEP